MCLQDLWICIQQEDVHHYFRIRIMSNDLEVLKVLSQIYGDVWNCDSALNLSWIDVVKWRAMLRGRCASAVHHHYWPDLQQLWKVCAWCFMGCYQRPANVCKFGMTGQNVSIMFDTWTGLHCCSLSWSLKLLSSFKHVFGGMVPRR